MNYEDKYKQAIPTSVPHKTKWFSDEFIKQFKKDFDL